MYDKKANSYIDRDDSKFNIEDILDGDLDYLSYNSTKDAKDGIFDITSDPSNYEIHEIAVDFHVKQRFNVETKIVKIEEEKYEG